MPGTRRLLAITGSAVVSLPHAHGRSERIVPANQDNALPNSTKQAARCGKRANSNRGQSAGCGTIDFAGAPVC